MRRLAFVLAQFLMMILIWSLSSERALAAVKRSFGLGVVVAGPTGITADYIYARNKDVSVALGWGSESLHVNLDHHWNKRDLIKADGVTVPVYYGLGLRILAYQGRDDDTDSEIGVRVPLGVQHIFRGTGLQIFAEIAPALILIDHTAFVIDIALGVRYFF